MSDPGITTLQRRVVRSLEWMKKQRQQNLDMVIDAGDSSLWCKDEADTIREHMNAIRDVWKHAEAMQARAEKAEAELREARMQMLSDAGQAAEAYEAQLRAEASCDAVMKDRAQIMAERDKTFALMLERAEKAEAQVERMRGLLSECADDLESYINAEYPINSRDAYPSVERRYLRDMELVSRVRKALAGDAP